MKLVAHTFRRTATITMPVSGTITHLPVIGSAIETGKDSIGNWPNETSPEIEITRNVLRTRCTFRSDVFSKDHGKLSEEESKRIIALTEFRSVNKALSWQPEKDPFLPVSMELKSLNQIREAKSILVNLLLNEKIRELVQLTPKEAFPVLEKRINKLLSPQSIKLCSAIIGFDESDTIFLACSALSEALRNSENIVVPKIHNPSSPFQLIAVNDQVLAAGHSVTSSIEDFNELVSEYISSARSYWKEISKRKLYNQTDIETLKSWRLVQAESDTSTFDLISSIENQLNIAQMSWEKTKKIIEVNFEMANTIGVLGIEYYAKGAPPLEDEFEDESFAKTIAREAANKLGYELDVAEGHYQTWGRLTKFIYNYFLLEKKTLFKILPGQPYKADWLVSLMKQNVIPLAANHLISTQMEFSVRGLFGGTNFKLNQIVLPNVENIEKPDLGFGVTTVRSALRDPYNIDHYMSELRTWRRDFEKILDRDPRYSDRRILTNYLELYENNVEQLEEIRTTLANVKSIDEIRTVKRAMFERMNSKFINEGNIDLPPDTRVISVFVNEGEFVAAGSPVLSVSDTFRCNGRAFLTSEELTALPLSPYSVWKIGYKEETEALKGISYVAIIGSIEPERENLWIVDLELFAVIEFDKNEIANLPKFLPLSRRYLGIHHAVTEDSLAKIEASFADSNVNSLTLLEKVY